MACCTTVDGKLGTRPTDLHVEHAFLVGRWQSEIILRNQVGTWYSGVRVVVQYSRERG